MAWTVTIGEGADQLVLSANVRFNLDASKSLNGKGDTVEAVDLAVEVEGVIRDSTPATVGSTIFDYLTHVTENFDAVRILIEQDGVDRGDFLPADCFIGPHVMNFKVIRTDEGGAGESHLRYSFSIVAKLKGQASGDNNSVYELHTSLETTKKNGKVIRKVWNASASSTSWQSAEAAVLGFKPSEKYITESVKPFYQEAKATAVWVWEAEDKGVLSWSCKTTARDGRVGFVGRARAGKGVDAVLYLKQRKPLRIQIDGQIISLDPTVAAPSPHFTESGTMFRATEEESDYGVAEVHDNKRGEYMLAYQEVWYSTGPTDKPIHSGNHHLVQTGLDPADGGIAG